ncbi:MAG TPA: HEAT repeat domain-containing protein [Candidatus Norongarragalinales archaeon]|jgi:hypothetical protein|nr:HEAT repeat domain-containing protein [Candidatus Norongarragalinales archaeon]
MQQFKERELTEEEKREIHKIKENDSPAFLGRKLESGWYAVRTAAAQKLAKMKSVGPAVERLGHKNPDVRQSAINALHMMKKGSRQVLRYLSPKTPSYIRQDATTALLLLRDPTMYKRMRKAMRKEKDPIIKGRLALTLYVIEQHRPPAWRKEHLREIQNAREKKKNG